MPARADVPPRRRWLAVVLLSLIVCVPALVRLLEVPARAPLRSWLIEEPSDRPPHPVALALIAQTAEADVFQVTLLTPDAAALTAVDRIDVAMATYDTAASLRGATLRGREGRCGFATAPGTALVNNQMLPLVRTGACPAGPATLQLDVHLRPGSGRVAVWTLEDQPGPWRLLEVASAAGPRLTVRGQTVRESPPSDLTRADLLASLWQITPARLWARAATIAALLVIGLAMIAAAGPAAGWREALAGAAGIGTLLGSLAMACALVIPPLQASDEPTHILSHALRSGHPTWAADTAALARRAHFERIRHRGDQHFRASDIGSPWPEAWSLSIAAVDVAQRSRLTAWWWDALDPWLRGSPIDAALWHMRLANAALFAGAVAVAAFTLAWLLPASSAVTAALSLAVVPTLPYYGMLWGDTPVILATSIVLAAAVAPIVLGSPRAWLAGAPLGLALTLVVLSGRRSWPLVLAVAAVLVAQAWSGVAVGSWKQRRAFWLGLLAVLVPAAAWVAALGILDEGAAQLSARATSLAGLADAVLARPWLPLAALAVLPIVDGWRHRSGAMVPGIGVTRLAMRTAAVALLGLTVWSGLGDLPTSNGVLVTTVSLRDYLATVAGSMVAPFRLGHFDLLLSTFFWSGLGWVDIVVPAWMLAGLGLTSAAAVSAWWWSAGGDVSGHRALLALGLLGGLTLALLAAAAGAYALKYDLYGRYLLGWYLLWLVPAWAHAAGRSRQWPWWLAPPLAVHAYTLQLALLRYF